MSELKLPNSLEESFEILKEFYKKDLIAIQGMTEDKFRTMSHMGSGQFIRNSWYLWWSEDHGYDRWPKDKPALVKFFNEKGITHADDMSGIIFTSLWRNVHGEDIDLEGQVKHYQDYWKKNGYENGIPKKD